MSAAGTSAGRALAAYADRLHAAIGAEHHVASPLGAWLVLALAGSGASGSERDEIGDVLGMDIADAGALARGLLEAPHPLVDAATAAWTRPEASTESLTGWLRGLPDAVEIGDVPDHAGADEWARRRTRGLIEAFPLEITPLTALVLASALATRVSWTEPFATAPASELGPDSSWSPELTLVLRAAPSHESFVAVTEYAGDVAVHTAHAGDGLSVTSVIAAAGVAPRAVLAAAHAVALATAVGDAIERRSLFDLPLGEGGLWSVAEHAQPTSDPSGREERCTALLPAWEASDDHDLMADPALGFGAAGRAMIALLKPDPRGFELEARQAVLARYSRTGFEAAAVTALGVHASGARRVREGVLRTAELRFGHPFAVVAVTTDARWDSAARAQRRGPWHGVPVFSAWVTSPHDADDGEGE